MSGYRRDVYKTLALVTQLGISVLAPIFLCVFAGIMIEKYFHVSLLIPLLILGILAGFRNMYVLAKRMIDHNDKGKKDEK